MKKGLSVFIAVVMSLGLLAACTTSQENLPATTDSPSSGLDSQASEKIKIGIVQHIDHPSLNTIRESIIEEFDTLGLSGNVEIVYKNAGGDMSALPSIMQTLVGAEVDLLIPIATPTAQAAAAATTSIPIVFSAVSNPVEAGLVEAFDKTDKNITGVSNSIAIEDIMALAKELTPNVKSFGFVYNLSEINSVTGIERAKAYCDKNSIAYKEVTVTSTNDLQQAAQSLVGKADAFFTPNDNMVASAMAPYCQVAEKANMPLYVGADSMVTDGGLATVGIDYTVLGKQTAQMAARLIEGKSVSEIPVEQIAEYAKMINMETARKIGITIPETLKDEFVILPTE